MTRFFPVAVALFVVVAAAGSATATYLLPLSWEQLHQAAERVVWLEAAGRRTIEVEGQPWTLVTCRVRRTFRGPAADSVVVRVPGGRRGNLTMKVPGAPIPEVGDSFVAFLELDNATETGQPTFRSVGLGQGMFQTVERDGATWLVQVIGRAPAKFAACGGDSAGCRENLGVLVRPLSDLAAPSTAAE